MEPIAAALEYDRRLTDDQNVLVLDVGGGTTDCTMVQLGPSFLNLKNREANILGVAGKRIGGIDFDKKIAECNVMPYFGRGTPLKNGKDVPHSLFWGAIRIDDIDIQEKFRTLATTKDIQNYIKNAREPEKLERLLTLQSNNKTYALHYIIEQAKIKLSDYEEVKIPLEEIECGFPIPLLRKQMENAVEGQLINFGSLMDDVVKQSGVIPDVIYVTGGTAKAPVVNNYIQSK